MKQENSQQKSDHSKKVTSFYQSWLVQSDKNIAKHWQ